MYVTTHAQNRLRERTGLDMFKREINAFAKRAKTVKGVNKRLRRVVLCGHQIDFVLIKNNIVTVYAERARA